ncbi:cyclase family protein [Gordonia sp. HY002]|uniref:cyclase family protein n=1 Tax=Gordonia zhenghanii TaxID=2911516 RepID=UPI001EF081D1|nr:cyclase family protein [Gordonia zhenghanii]MCF8568771.1 cyclase family protein [Gordonia zhenghanii]MCF8606104.1 cyclase family protein [Gordonia zhenghanii]
MSTRRSNWGRWGAADEKGALNLLTPESVLAALRIPRTGKRYSLGIPIQRSGVPNMEYRGTPQRLTMINHDDEAMAQANGGAPGVGAHEDQLIMPSHTSTHMDALCHVYSESKIYNGYPHDGVRPYSGADKCGIENVDPIVGRGVLIDVAASKGVDALAAGYVVTRGDLKQALDKQGVALAAGDLVLIRTGWLEEFMRTQGELLPQPGIGVEAATYLAECDVALVGSDNSAVEAIPFDRDIYLGGHIVLLVDNGIHLVENLDLKELAADGCHEFLLTIGALNISGGTASPVTPVAVG